MNEKQSRKATAPTSPELLAPAGSFEKLVTAIHYGADAVYLGGTRFGLRARAGTFSDEDIGRAVSYAHARGVKVYVTVNIIAHNDDFNGLDDYLEMLVEAGVDGIVVSDPGVISRVRQVAPELPIHLSTQANVTNVSAARFWESHGVQRINLARELSFREITAMRRALACEIEVFVHGALCISYSGRCLLSHYLTGRDANRGNCAHPCRYRYALIEEKRPGEYFPIEEDERGAYIFNSKDLCLLGRLPLLAAAGIDAVKIEGRMKSLFYVGAVVRVYRSALDYLASLPGSAWRQPEAIELPGELLEEITRTGTRDLTENFFGGQPGPDEMLYRTSRFDQPFEPVAVVREAGAKPLVELRNVLQKGERVECMQRRLVNDPATVAAIVDESGQEVAKANPGNRVFLHLEPEIATLDRNQMIRRRKGARDR